MAQIADSGGSGRKPDRREKDDVYTPVHKTDDFRETVRRIKEKDDGSLVAPKKEESKQPTFNVPIPGTNTAQMGRGGIPTYFYKEQRAKNREQTRKDVIYDLAAKLPKGVKLSDIGGPDFDLRAYIDY